jgi:hypothetical protein
VITLLALLLATVKPPTATADPGHVRLAISSWCWGTHCGAPIAASGKPVVVARDATVRIRFSVVPTSVRVAVSGKTLVVARRGSLVSWHVRRWGGMTVNVTFRGGFVTYVGRLAAKR